MASGLSDFFTFVKGLNTEGGTFTMPEGTWREGDNVIPRLDASLSRRNGIDYEVDGTTITGKSVGQAARLVDAYTTWEWEAPGGDGKKRFLVVQLGSSVIVIDSSSDPLWGSGSTILHTVDLSAGGIRAQAGESASIYPIKGVSGSGSFIITAQNINPVLLKYNSLTNVFTTIALSTMYIRDFEGVDDGLGNATRPTTLSNLHEYNLVNQGWYPAFATAVFTDRGSYPSNAESWHYARDSSDNFDPAKLSKLAFGSARAGRGYYQLNLFNRDRSTLSSIAGIPVETEYWRFTTSEFYAGRAWFSGLYSSPKYASTVFFSEVIQNDNSFRQLMQSGDPSAEYNSELIDSDGGYVTIQDAGQIIDLVALVQGIVVFAQNGIWLIGPTNDSGFAATSYAVTKLSDVRVKNKLTNVVVENSVFLWAEDGLYRIQPNQQGYLEVGSVSDGTIKTLYNSIPTIAKDQAQGCYNSVDKVVFWLYNANLSSDTSDPVNKKTNILALNTVLTSFYTYSINDITGNSPYVISVIPSVGKKVFTSTVDVVVGSDEVIDSNSNIVGTSFTREVTDSRVFKFLTVVPGALPLYNFRFSDFEAVGKVVPNKFRDWYTANSSGVTNEAYVITGHVVSPKHPSMRKSAIYSTIFMKRTETAWDVDGNVVNESGCYFQTMWDFGSSSVSNKWSSEQQAYKHKLPYIVNGQTSFDDGFNITRSRLRVRGAGTAVQIKLSSDGDKDMQLVGWSTAIVGNDGL